MLPSDASQSRVIVKRRGTKFRVAESESPRDRDASRRDIASQDDRFLDPGRDRQTPVLAK
jgi:hypothetical protein